MKKICGADFRNGAASPGEQEVYHTPVLPQQRFFELMLIAMEEKAEIPKLLFPYSPDNENSKV